MKIVAICTLLFLLPLCFAGCARSKNDVLTYTRQLRPGMSVEDVKATYPKEMHWIDEAADESKEYCWMTRCYSTNLVTRRLCFKEVGYSARGATVYFDSDKRLVGIDTLGSGNISLKPGELRFPDELRFPSEFAGGRSAYPELYRRAIPGSVTNQP